MAVGERLRDLRQRRGWTQSQLAERYGTSAVTISDWERGRTKPDVDQIPKLADLLACQPADFFTDPSTYPETVATYAQVRETAGSAFLRGVNESLERLPPHERETAERLLRIVDESMGLLNHVLAKGAA